MNLIQPMLTMPEDHEDLEPRMERCRRVLRSAGVKLTNQRLEVFREVAKSGEHPDAEAILKGVRKRLPTVSLDTVYRTLWMLTDLGLISTVGLPRERFRFDGNMKPHHHFICGRCGMTGDFYSDVLDQLRVADLVEGFGAVEKVQVEVRGLCRECMAEGDSPQLNQDKEGA